MEVLARIVSVRRATPSSHLLRVHLGGAAFEYEAGQAATIAPPGTDVRVPYSIASSPEDTAASGTLEFLVKADAPEKWGPAQPPFTRGMTLVVHGPFGAVTFPREPAERRFLFVAGGTGIAPLRSMIRHAIARGYANSGSGDASAGTGPPSLLLLYSARARDQFAFLPELRAMARRGELALALNVTRDVPARWRGTRGRVAGTQLAALVAGEPTLCFVCGPDSMMAEVPPMLAALGVPAERIRVERW